ncbi:hypothetical protein [Streptomyces sp. NPDC046805]|uniref:hypothetical protein n=1 Tax=Streptomyces sp. NPDC046805 TaxID=3155134 RepID=UPI0033CCF33A
MNATPTTRGADDSSGAGTPPAGGAHDAHEPSAVVHLRPLGSPLPLGFLGLAGGTLVTAGLQLGWVPTLQGYTVSLILFTFVFPTQFVAALLGFWCRDTGVGTAMGILSCTWLAIAAVTALSPPGATSAALGLLLIVAGAALLVPVAAAGRGKLAASAVLTFAAVRFLLIAVYQLSAWEEWETAAGALGLALTGLAVYAAAAFALEDVRKSPVIPVGRARATPSTDDERFSTAADEPGVRPLL